MSRPATFRQSDIARAVRGARQGGMAVGRVEVVGGRILLFPVDAQAPEDEGAALRKRMDEAFNT